LFGSFVTVIDSVYHKGVLLFEAAGGYRMKPPASRFQKLERDSREFLFHVVSAVGGLASLLLYGPQAGTTVGALG
jgi:hypothetical protein